MPFPSVNFTFWLCVCLPPTLLLTLREVSKSSDRSDKTSMSNLMAFVEKFRFKTSSVHWRLPKSLMDLTDMESLLFAIYAGYMVIMVMCYWVIANIRHANREMEKIIHDANEEMAATGLLQLENKTLPDVQVVTLAGDSLNEEDPEKTCFTEKEEAESDEEFKEAGGHDLVKCEEQDNSIPNSEIFDEETHDLINYSSKEGNDNVVIEQLINFDLAQSSLENGEEVNIVSNIYEPSENSDLRCFESRDSALTDSVEVPNELTAIDEHHKNTSEMAEHQKDVNGSVEVDTSESVILECPQENSEMDGNVGLIHESSSEIITVSLDLENSSSNIENHTKLSIYVKEYSDRSVKIKCGNVLDDILSLENKEINTTFDPTENSKDLINQKSNPNDDEKLHSANVTQVDCAKFQETVETNCSNVDKETVKRYDDIYTTEEKDSIRVCEGKYQEYKQKYLQIAQNTCETDLEESDVSAVIEKRVSKQSSMKHENKAIYSPGNVQVANKIHRTTATDAKVEKDMLMEDQNICTLVLNTKAKCMALTENDDDSLISEKELRNSRENEKELDSVEENGISEEVGIQSKNSKTEPKTVCAKEKKTEYKIFRHVSRIEKVQGEKKIIGKMVENYVDTKYKLLGKSGYGAVKKMQGKSTNTESGTKVRLPNISVADDKRRHTLPLQNGSQRHSTYERSSGTRAQLNVTERTKSKKQVGYLSVYGKEYQEYSKTEDQSLTVVKESRTKQNDKNVQNLSKQRVQGKLREKLGTLSNKMRDFRDKLKSKDLKIIKNELKKEEYKNGECSEYKEIVKNDGLKVIPPTSNKPQKNDDFSENCVVQYLFPEKSDKNSRNMEAKVDSKTESEERNTSDDEDDDDGDQWDEEGLNEWLRTTW